MTTLTASAPAPDLAPTSNNTPAPHPSHGGARPNAGRKPKATPDLSSLLESLSTDPAALAQLTECLTEALPQLLEALVSLAQGATTTRERWVAAGTLTTGIGSKTRLLMPNLPVDQLVLVASTTTKHKPDLKALFFLLEHFLGKLPAITPPQTVESPTPQSQVAPSNTEPTTPVQPAPPSTPKSHSPSPPLLLSSSGIASVVDPNPQNYLWLKKHLKTIKNSSSHHKPLRASAVNPRRDQHPQAGTRSLRVAFSSTPVLKSGLRPLASGLS